MHISATRVRKGDGGFSSDGTLLEAARHLARGRAAELEASQDMSRWIKSVLN